jgi:hypothetical protein
MNTETIEEYCELVENGADFDAPRLEELRERMSRAQGRGRSRHERGGRTEGGTRTQKEGDERQLKELSVTNSRHETDAF